MMVGQGKRTDVTCTSSKASATSTIESRPPGSSHQHKETVQMDIERQNHSDHDDEKIVSSSPNSAEAKEDDEFPEGGLEAWACVVGTFMVMGFSFGYVSPICAPICNLPNFSWPAQRFWYIPRVLQSNVLTRVLAK